MVGGHKAERVQGQGEQEQNSARAGEHKGMRVQRLQCSRSSTVLKNHKSYFVG